jgi:hypothetical protein
MQKLASGTCRDLANRWDEINSGYEVNGEPLGELNFVQSPSKVSPGMFLFGANMPQVVNDE